MWLSVNRSCVLKVIGPLWLYVNLQFHFLGGPIEVWIVAWAWLSISLGEPKFHSLGPVDPVKPVKRRALQGVRQL